MAGSLKIKELILENSDGTLNTSITLGDDGKLNFGGGFSSGKILQVKTAYTGLEYTLTDTYDLLSLSITPTKNTSKFLLSGFIHLANDTSNHSQGLQILRNGIVIGSGSAGGAPITSQLDLHSTVGVGGDITYSQAPVPINWLDTPNTVSTITYVIRAMARPGYSSFINRPNDNGNYNHIANPISVLTVMEVDE